MNTLNKFAVSGLVGLVSLFSPSRTLDASVMNISTALPQETLVADGKTEYRMDVYADSTNVPDKTITGSQWHITVPSYLSITRASLPDSTHDYFYNIIMDSGWNRVDSIVSNGELADNVRLSNDVVSGAENKVGLLGSYWFTVDSDAPLGDSNFSFNWVKFTSSDIPTSYRSGDGLTNSQIQVYNENFNIIPEPVTLPLLALGGLALIRKRKSTFADKQGGWYSIGQFDCPRTGLQWKVT